MNERPKITASHLSRQAIVYLRQSSAAQVEHNRESTDRQYALAAKARELGWPNDRIIVIDEDLGLSGSGFVARSGFARLTAEVALAHVGLVLGLEVSRLARNNADLHRLIDLGGLNVFASFAETGSARRVWLWCRSEGLTFPLQMHQNAEIRWVEASYTAIHHVLTNPVYAGAYAYGKSRQETMLDAAGARTKRV